MKLVTEGVFFGHHSRRKCEALNYFSNKGLLKNLQSEYYCIDDVVCVFNDSKLLSSENRQKNIKVLIWPDDSVYISSSCKSPQACCLCSD